ncbi:MAG: S41 family peptidase [Phycisphaerales bacterium]|nr:S41 family peptidase [Phycisphaerales bacterium]
MCSYRDQRAPMVSCPRAIATLTLVSILTGCGSSGPIVYDASLRERTFDTYHGAMVEHYPDAHEAGIDTAEFRSKWRDAVVNAQSVTEYYHTLARMCYAMGDPHLVLRPNYELWETHDGPLGATDLCVLQVHGRPVLWNRSHDLLQSFGLKSSSEDKNLNGWTIEAFNGSRFMNDSTLRSVLNIGPEGSELVVRLRSPADESQLTLHRRRGLDVDVEARDHLEITFSGTQLFAKAKEINRQFVDDWATFASTVAVYHGTYFSAWALDGVGIFVWLPSKTLPRSDEGTELLQADLDAAADILQGTTCTLIDLRFQPGGLSSGFTMVMERLLSGGVKMVAANQTKELFGLITVTHARTIPDSSSITSGPAVILVNEFTGSYGEWLASLLRRDLEAPIVGARTSGSEYCIVDVEGPDGSSLRFGGAPYRRFGDIPAFQGVGITPDIVVATAEGDLLGQSVQDTLIETHKRQWQAAWDLLRPYRELGD